MSKREASDNLTKDNYMVEEESQVNDGIQRASEEVMSTRQIARPRKSKASALRKNPFQSINMLGKVSNKSTPLFSFGPSAPNTSLSTQSITGSSAQTDDKNGPLPAFGSTAGNFSLLSNTSSKNSEKKSENAPLFSFGTPLPATSQAPLKTSTNMFGTSENDKKSTLFSFGTPLPNKSPISKTSVTEKSNNKVTSFSLEVQSPTNNMANGSGTKNNNLNDKEYNWGHDLAKNLLGLNQSFLETLQENFKKNSLQNFKNFFDDYNLQRTKLLDKYEIAISKIKSGIGKDLGQDIIKDSEKSSTSHERNPTNNLNISFSQSQHNMGSIFNTPMKQPEPVTGNYDKAISGASSFSEIQPTFSFNTKSTAKTMDHPANTVLNTNEKIHNIGAPVLIENSNEILDKTSTPKVTNKFEPEKLTFSFNAPSTDTAIKDSGLKLDSDIPVPSNFMKFSSPFQTEPTSKFTNPTFSTGTNPTATSAPTPSPLSFSFSAGPPAPKQSEIVTPAPLSFNASSLNSFTPTFQFGAASAIPSATSSIGPLFGSSLSNDSTTNGGGNDADEGATEEALEQIDTETLMEGEGEEDEETVYTDIVKVSEIVKDAENFKWKDIGKGELRIKRKKNESNKCRILVRSPEALGRVLLNCLMYDGMKLKKENEKKVTLNCYIYKEETKQNALVKVCITFKSGADPFIKEFESLQK
ncbi:hypothetical protein HDU92_001275 [Lobulomyces angularis]|nr:hypothetical protein HDU92_001275 [Lobulomyces angularis]